MTFLKIEAKYQKLLNFLGVKTEFSSKEDYLDMLALELPRTLIYAQNLDNFKSILKAIEDTNHLDKLNQYFYCQGDFDGRSYTELPIAISKLRQPFADKNPHSFDTLSFCFEDDEKRLCGFSVTFLETDDKPFIMTVVRDVTATIYQRQVMVVADTQFDDVIIPELGQNFSKIDDEYKTEFDASNLQEQLKSALKSEEVSKLLLPLFPKGVLDKNQFDKLTSDVQKLQRDLIDERINKLKNLFDEWINNRKDISQQIKIEAQIENEFKNINKHFRIHNQFKDPNQTPEYVIKMLYILDAYERLVAEFQKNLPAYQEHSRAFYSYLRWSVFFLLICTTGGLTLSDLIPAMDVLKDSALKLNLTLFLTVTTGILTLMFSYQVWNNYYLNPEPKPYQDSWNEYLDSAPKLK